LAKRNYHEFARGKPRRILSSQLSGKAMNSQFSASRRMGRFWACWFNRRALTVASGRRSPSRCIVTFTAFLLGRFLVRARSIYAEPHCGTKERPVFEGNFDDGSGLTENAGELAVSYQIPNRSGRG